MPPFPWQDRPADCSRVLWRHDRNPIIARDAIPGSNSIFNSAAVPFGEGYAGVFRCDDRRREMRLHAGFSADGINWEIDHEPIEWRLGGEPLTVRDAHSLPLDGRKGLSPPEYGYDPRVCWIEDRYWITWCNGYHGPCIGIGYTFDFKEFTMLENALLPFNRNGVLFPRKVGGNYMMLSRPSDNGHTPFGEIFLSQSQDMVHWGRHRWVMRPEQPWESTKIGAGPIPIETPEGWLMIYHGVLTSCNGFVYHFGACLLDLEEPWRVIARGSEYLLSPQKPYEQIGDVPNVVFPCAALVDGDRVAIYYGGADTVTCLAFGYVSEIVDWVKR
ncbi:MAG: glycoside hydrolase family 130 protein [Fimbriimonadaceae bacterium]